MERHIDQLRLQLGRLDSKNYGAYKQIKGSWVGEAFELCVDHVQGDPFASPSRVRLRIPERCHGIAGELRRQERRRVASCDYILRAFAAAVHGVGGRSGSGHSGEVVVDAGDDVILERSGCGFVDGALELRFRVGLPARGRRILGRAASELLCDELPRAAREVHHDRLDVEGLRRFVELVEDHAALTDQLAAHGLVAFVADGSILPRRTGVSTAPLPGAVPFCTPESLAIVLETPHRGPVRGMGLPEGVSLITGGGFHGKTTLLEAIQAGIYPHVPGDGRELVATAPCTVKVRSEDGRSVVGVDLSAFISDLPGGRGTSAFTTPDASGSTSLAAAIVESLEVGATSLLLDEDTSATNLLIRDARMQALVRRETITPLIDRVRQLHAELGVSTVLVVGGSGDYLEVADTVVLMQDYRPLEVTREAREIVASHPTTRAVQSAAGPLIPAVRRPRGRSFDPATSKKGRVRARGVRELRFGDETVDLTALEQLVDDSQARAIGVLLRWMAHNAEGASLTQIVDETVATAKERGLYAIDPLPELAAVRSIELAAALNRLRSLELES